MENPSSTPPRLLHQFFDHTAERFPDRIAIDVPPSPDRPVRISVTYGELLAQADALASLLRPYMAPDRVAGILLPRNSHRLYVAQLAVLKAGGAFTCLDPIFPDAHVESVLKDGDVTVLLTDSRGISRIHDSDISVQITIDVTASPTDGKPSDDQVRLPAATTAPEHLAYVIYTSGTTGAPKGVLIEHRSVVNLVASDLDEFRLTPHDRVAQGSSAAYDSSIEEIWLAFAAGATLVVMDDHTSRMGPDLVPWLQRERISVFCPPPTLLRTTGCTDPASALPDLRLLYVGGEALTEDLAERWARGRRMVNGYGPTECTVTVVRGDVRPGRTVSIGRPVPGHTAWVVDAALKAVAEGEAGELCLAGIGLARGYHNRDTITREKFVEHPVYGRIYRTGDRVRRDADGELRYLGRVDAQVKLRGYRVELEAIEACIGQCDGVLEAACRVRGEGGDALLEAHLVAADAGAPPMISAIREALRRTLPPYMVPTRFGWIDALPRSVGGKVDRARLPALGSDGSDPRRDVVAPANRLQAVIVDAFASAVRTGSPVSTRDDFFLDLGGDSLSAVGVICTLRNHPETASATTRDLYETRSAERLAARLEAHPVRPSSARPRHSTPQDQATYPFLVTVAQALWLLLALVVVSAAGYGVVYEILPPLLKRFGLLGTLLLEIPLALAGMLGFTILTILLTVFLKWALIGQYRPIRTPVWSGLYLRHWIVQSVARAIPWDTLAGTVAYGAVLRLLGAKVGRRVHIHRGVNLQLGGWDLLTLGDDVTLARDVHLGLVVFDDGCLNIGPVEIQSQATLETRASVSAHSVVETGGYLTALSWLPAGKRISAGAKWDGVPAKPDERAPIAPAIHSGRRINPALHTTVHLSTVGLTQSGATVPILAAIYALAHLFGLSADDIVSWLYDPSWSVVFLSVTLAVIALCIPVWLAVQALCVRGLGRIRPTTMDRWSLAYLRVWHKSLAVESAGLWLSGTLFWPIWLRLAGADIGKHCEISTITDVVPETLRIGAESFLADGIYLGGPHVHRGTVTLGATSLGRGTFLGNHVVIPTGANLPDDFFLGVCTVADATHARTGSSWFGHPPLELPKRQVVSVDHRLTHHPGPLRYGTRLFWESLRFALPILPAVIGGASLWGMAWIQSGVYFRALVQAPAVALAAISVLCLAVVALKWLLLGRARAGQHPLWSCWCSRWDFLYVAWQFHALRALAALEGTLLLSMYLRAMGVKIGRRVVLGPGLAQFADPDMITIEDGATVNASFQAHSFEDRVLKLGPVLIRRDATIGDSAVVFYGADIGAQAWVAPNSVVMKQETLSPDLSYCGCPVQAQDEDDCGRHHAVTTNSLRNQ